MRDFEKVIGKMAAASLAALVAACSPQGSQVPADVASSGTCSVPPATVATWFKSGSVSLDGEVTPANSATFPGVPNCDFYTWSERMFLWVTSPTPPSYGGGGGRIFASPAFFDVSPADSMKHRMLIKHSAGRIPIFQLRDAQLGAHELPLFHDKRGKMFEVQPTPLGPSKLPMIHNAQGEMVEIQRSALDDKGLPQFFDAAGARIQTQRARTDNFKPERVPLVQKFNIAGRSFFIDAFGNLLEAEQAEADDGILVGQNNSLVYYTVEVNDVFGYLASGMNSPVPVFSPATFPTSAAAVTPIQTYATSKGAGTFPDPEALAVELKTAWVEATALPSGCTYITMKAKVPTYDTADPAHWKVTGTATKTLAMVGMHVVGSTAGHAEMIWATFEHVCNAPNPGYHYNGASPNEAGPAEHGPWLFSSSDAPADPNIMRQSYDAGVSPAQIDANTSQMVWPHTVGPADISRTMPWGVAGSNASSNTQVIATNHTVLSQLASGDVRSNYIMTGATWTIGGVINGTQVGTNLLANTTMETYQQGSLNCFDCHNNPTADPKGNLGLANGQGLSHIFGEIQPLP